MQLRYIFSITTFWRISVRSLAAWILDAFGTLFMTAPSLLNEKLSGSCWLAAAELEEQQGPNQGSSIASICLLVNFTHLLWNHTLQFSHSIHCLDLVLLSSMSQIGQRTETTFLVEFDIINRLPLLVCSMLLLHYQYQCRAVVNKIKRLYQTAVA